MLNDKSIKFEEVCNCNKITSERPPVACVMKYYEAAIYIKMTNFVVSYRLLALTSTLAGTNKHASLLRNQYITDP